MKEQQQSLSKTSINLHWIIAIGIIALMIVGTYMQTFKVYAVYPIHKSIGTLILFIILARLVWRIKQGWPTPSKRHSKLERFTAKVTHWILLLGSVLFPLSGLMMSGAGGYGVAIFGWELISSQYGTDGKAIPYNASIAQAGHYLHGVLANIFIAIISLHILGALKHHFYDKDATLRRMLGK